MSEHSNPYSSSEPVRSAEMFFGRSRELEEIAQYLRTGQSVSLAGPRGIGKTSLLIHLARPAVAGEHGVWDGCLAGHIDCAQLADATIADMFRRFSDALSAGLSSRGLPELTELRTASGSPSRLAFESAVRALNQRGLLVILLLDHFEEVSANPLLGLPFYNALRSAAGRFKLAFLTASNKPLIELTYRDHPQEILSSPFFNIFAPLRLGLLPEADARELIRKPAARAGSPFTSEMQNFLYQWAGGHPLLLQAACRSAIESPEDPASIRERTTAEFRPFFEALWLSLDVSDQLALIRVKRISPLRPASESEADGLRRLEQMGLVVSQNGSYSFACKILEEFIARVGDPGNS